MSQLIEEPRLFAYLCSTHYLGIGFILVKRNRGKPGIDGVSIQDFEANLDEELSQLQQELTTWTYQPSPVRRLEIPKPDGKGVRLLGIPTVRDRVVQTTLKLLLEPIFDAHFSPNSYGAIHPIPGVHPSGQANMINGVVNPSKEGAMPPLKGGLWTSGPLSPLLSNIVLDELDQELEKRGLEFCRFADDCNIFVKSQKAAERVIPTGHKWQRSAGSLKRSLNSR